MDFLAACQRVRQDARISGTGPTSVVDQIGQLKKVVDYTATAYIEILNRHTNWRFLWSRFQISTIQAQADYGEADMSDLEGLGSVTFQRIDTNTLKFYKQSDGVSAQGSLTFKHWEDWVRDYENAHDIATQGPPTVATMTPLDKLRITPPPAADTYIIKGHYYRRITRPTTNTAALLMPADFQELVVHRGLMLYGQHEDDPTAYNTGKERWQMMMPLLEQGWTPRVEPGDPLA